MFIDKIRIYCKAGNGGNGAVSFRREKYVAKGGPDGGDGGNGGNIIFQIDEGANTLLAFRYKRKFVAGNGDNGAGAKFHGKNGEDVIIKVPVGTVIKDAQSGQIIKDMSDDEQYIALKGGRGGWGNKHFATPTRQIPRFAKNGIVGEEKEFELELKMIADVGLVGLPSAGKSSLLASVSAARPKIAEYHFTTLEPNLGVVSLGNEKGFVMADIPGLIEGASEGAGLGHAFLRHIERCRMLVQVVDAAGTEGRTPLEDFEVISEELEKFSPELATRPRIIAANKSDLLDDELKSTGDCKDLLDRAKELGYKVVFISCATQEGVKDLIHNIGEMLKDLPPIKVYESEIVEEVFDENDGSSENVTVRRDSTGAFVVEGKWIDLLINRTNFDDRESSMYFEKMLIKGGIIQKLRDSGCGEGNTVKLGDIEFDFVD